MLLRKSLLKTSSNKKMLVMSNFYFSHNLFYPIEDQSNVLSNISFVVCKCFQFYQGQNFVDLLPNDKILDLSKFKAYADNKYRRNLSLICVKKTLRDKENMLITSIFYLFYTILSKGFLITIIDNLDCVVNCTYNFSWTA